MAKKVIGGIYYYPEEPDFYMLYFNNAMYGIEKIMLDIEQDVEYGFDNKATLLEGYALGATKVSENLYEWVIRDSGRKHTKDYIKAKGPCSEQFFRQISRFAKSF